jgi:hypothetical protein
VAETARLGRRQARTQGARVPGGTRATEDAAWRRSEAAVSGATFREGGLALSIFDWLFRRRGGAWRDPDQTYPYTIPPEGSHSQVAGPEREQGEHEHGGGHEHGEHGGGGHEHGAGGGGEHEHGGGGPGDGGEQHGGDGPGDSGGGGGNGGGGNGGGGGGD